MPTWIIGHVTKGSKKAILRDDVSIMSIEESPFLNWFITPRIRFSRKEIKHDEFFNEEEKKPQIEQKRRLQITIHL